MEKVIAKYNLESQPENDLEFWEAKTHIERLNAIEKLRQQYIALFLNGNRPRFQRVYNAFKQA